MKNASTIVQFALLIIGISLLFFFVRPAFSEISERQDTLSEYSNAIAQATQVNQLLNNLLTTIESIPAYDRIALDEYLPLSIDAISVQRDLKAYVDQSPVLLGSLSQMDGGNRSSSSQVNTDTSGAGDMPVGSSTGSQALLVNEHRFSVSVAGSYTDIKDLLQAVEMNAYPLHLESIALAPTDTNDLQAEIVFVTYEFNNESQ